MILLLRYAMTFGDLLLEDRRRTGNIDPSCGKFETGVKRRYVGHGPYRYDYDEILAAMISLQNLAKKYVQLLLGLFLRTRSYSQEAKQKVFYPTICFEHWFRRTNQDVLVLCWAGRVWYEAVAIPRRTLFDHRGRI